MTKSNFNSSSSMQYPPEGFPPGGYCCYEMQGKTKCLSYCWERQIEIIKDFVLYEKLYLLTAYPKSEKDNLTKAERNELKKLVERRETELGKNG